MLSSLGQGIHGAPSLFHSSSCRDVHWHCDFVRYCSDECLQDHRPEHEAKCEERAAELRDEILFRQPEGSHLGVGDCPICCLPFPLDPKNHHCIHVAVKGSVMDVHTPTIGVSVERTCELRNAHFVDIQYQNQKKKATRI
jgi:hypothetical protein